jgi:hypothetical protein
MSFSPAHDAIRDQAETYLEDEYGRESTHYLAYHGLLHSQQVAANAALISSALPDGYMTIQASYNVELAGICHDLVQDPHDPEHNELRSAELAVSWMRQDGRLGRLSRDMVYYGILATKLVMENGRLHESPRFERATCRVVLTDAIIADADLASLGKPWEEFDASSQLLFQERYPEALPDGAESIAFDHEQVRFLDSHEFYLEQSRQLFPHQAENRQLVVERLAEAGEDVSTYR